MEINTMKIVRATNQDRIVLGSKMQAEILPGYGIKDVWADNIEEEFATIRQLITKYYYVAMDTQFPGFVAKPIGDFKSLADYEYQMLRCNVDLLKIIQLGLSFFDKNGNTPPGPFSSWQFNFKFDLSQDMYAQNSIDLLINSRIQFQKHEQHGIEQSKFAELMTTSGMVLDENINWITFHSNYDFGYLLKMLTDEKLPPKESDFFGLLSMFFPIVYDVKYLMKRGPHLGCGLQEIADQLKLTRIGPQHQAGSNSSLTGMAFFKIKETYFEGKINREKYCGRLFGFVEDQLCDDGIGNEENKAKDKE